MRAVTIARIFFYKLTNINLRKMKPKRIVIAGGGFAGINLISKLKNNKAFEIILVDLNNYHFFPPLIYQVASGFMEPSAISYPFRKIIAEEENVRFRLGELQRVIPNEKKVILHNGELQYDILVLATGTESNYFGMENVKNNAIPMKTIADALSMRNKLLINLEEATRTTDVNERKKLIGTVIAGAGPTGVELAGMFAEMRENIIKKDYPEFTDEELGEVILVDGAATVLPPMSEQSQKYTQEKLKKLGVKIMLNTNVSDFVDDKVYLTNGAVLETKNLIWTAGVKAKTFDGFNEEDYGKGARLLVDEHNKLLHYTDIYALGDTCLMTADKAFENGHPQLAQAAIQQALNLGENLKKSSLQDWKPFAYNDKGSMAIIGRNKAVADLPKFKKHFNGFFAWFIWVFIHIMSLVTYKNRLAALYNWVISYFSKDQSFRMIIEPKEKVK